MTYLIGYHALWLIAALALGVTVGAATFERYRDRLMDLIVWAVVVAWLFGAYLALTKALPDRVGYGLELALLMSFVYGVGCFVGWVLRGVTSDVAPEAAVAGGHHHGSDHGSAPARAPDAKAVAVADAPRPVHVTAPKPADVVELAKPAPVAEATKPVTVVEAPNPTPAAEAAKPAAAAKVSKPDAVTEAPKLAVAIEAPKPAATVEAPKPAPVVEAAKPAPVVEVAKPAAVSESAKPASVAEGSKLAAVVEASKSALTAGSPRTSKPGEPPKPVPAVTEEPKDDAHSGTRPLGFAAPEGEPDDLKRIRGIGPQNEGRLHGLGIWHFRQIASWTPDNVEWVGSYLAFPGRIDREEWVQQAKVLAAGAETEFSKRVDAGEVPTSLGDGTAGQNNIEKVEPREA